MFLELDRLERAGVAACPRALRALVPPHPRMSDLCWFREGQRLLLREKAEAMASLLGWRAEMAMRLPSVDKYLFQLLNRTIK